MKRAEKSEQSCRRQEFVCRLYDVIKDLDKSLKTDCNRGGNQFMREKGNPFAPRPTKTAVGNKKKGEECFCPPGCCEDSLEFKLSRIPNYPGMEGAQSQAPKETRGAPHQGGGFAPSGHGQDPSEHLWHKPYHSNGCWAGHDHHTGSSPGGGGGHIPSPSQTSGPPGVCIPSSPEEAIAMGCFVARAA